MGDGKYIAPEMLTINDKLHTQIDLKKADIWGLGISVNLQTSLIILELALKSSFSQFNFLIILSYKFLMYVF